MGKFKRVSLAGSSELFRSTRPRVVDETDETINDLVDRRPRQSDADHQEYRFTPDEVQLLHDQIGSFVGHALNLVRLTYQIHAYHSASAPEMISISSLVIIAWRVRL